MLNTRTGGEAEAIYVKRGYGEVAVDSRLRARHRRPLLPDDA